MKPTLILAIGGAILIAACSGGERVAGIDSRGNPTPAVGVVAKGSITGFGSVIVNGVTYNTNSAIFTIDGNLGTQADLAVGDVVVIEGTVDSGAAPVASSVTFDDAVQGPISGIDLAAETLIVLGQFVRVDAATSFDDSIDPRSLDGLGVNDYVEVSGFFLADGSISATRIELKAPLSELEVTGIVSNAGASTFEINGFVVDFSAATPEGFPNGAPEDGQRVEAKGDELVGGELIATRVQFKSSDLGDDGDEAEVEGFITVFNSAADFEVEGIRVTTNAQTVYQNGTSGDLAINRKIEVEGSINASGAIDAENIEFKASGALRVEALVETVQVGGLTILGIDIRVDDATRYEDSSVLDLENFGFSDIFAGDYLEIRGYEDQDGFIATQIDRDDFRGDVAVRGFVESVANPDFVILGVTIATSAATTFTDNDGSTNLTPAEFFGPPGPGGRLVEASGSLNGAIINADEVEFQD
jgi:hypothetical protein